MELKEGPMTKAERDEAVAGIDTGECYDLFVELVTENFGYFPQKRTQLKDEKCAWQRKRDIINSHYLVSFWIDDNRHVCHKKISLYYIRAKKFYDNTQPPPRFLYRKEN